MENVYVLDTSVLVHDPDALEKFTGASVVVPIYVVMELDHLKGSRRPEVAASSRQVSRTLAELTHHGDLHAQEGIWVENWGVRVFFAGLDGLSGLEALDRAENAHKMDRLILESALKLRELMPNRKVALVSKDVNLRLLAQVEGLQAEDYENDKVGGREPYSGVVKVDELGDGTLREVYAPGSELRPEDIGVEGVLPNGFIHAWDERRGKDLLLRAHGNDRILRPVLSDYRRRCGVDARNVEQRMALDLLLDPNVQLVHLIGKAGTGKTFLALASAIAQLYGDSPYERVLLSKPVVSMGQDLGYLPGDFEAKMAPWVISFLDNLDQLIQGEKGSAKAKGAHKDEKHWEQLFESGKLDVQAIHSIRGRSIASAFMIIDEVQNLTPHEVKTIITRAAEGTKVVLCGDPYQVDNRFLDRSSNGLVHVNERLKGSGLCGTVYFTQGERSELAELASTLL